MATVIPLTLRCSGGCPRQPAVRDASRCFGIQDVVVLFAAKNSVRGLMAHDELDELLAMLDRERAVIDRYELEACGDASADDVAEDYTATDQLYSDERSL